MVTTLQNNFSLCNGLTLSSIKATINMIDDVIFCRRPLSQLDGHMSSGAYHKLENLRALKESEVKRTLIDLLIEEVDEKNYIAHGLIENKGRGRVTTIKYIISFSFIRGMVWIIDDIEIL